MFDDRDRPGATGAPAASEERVELRVVDRIEDFEAAREEWDELLASSPARSFFLSWAWLYSWWRELSNAAQLCILEAREDGRLCAAAPLMLRRALYYRAPVRELTFIGDQTSDRQDLIWRSGRETSLTALWRRLAGNPFEVTLLRLDQIPEGSRSLVVGRAVAPDLEVEPSSVLNYLSITGSFEDYEKVLSSRFRTDLRSRLRKLGARGAWEVRHAMNSDTLALLDEVVALEERSDKQHRGTAFLTHPRRLAFIRRVIESAGPRHDVLLSSLLVGGRLAGYSLGFIYGGVYHGFSTAYDPEFHTLAPGKIIIHETLRHAFQLGLDGFDFLRGGAALKSRWRGDARCNVRAVLFFAGLRGAALRFAVFRARPAIKRLLARPGKES